MGRRIENKRVISNDRVRKERKQKNKIIIAVEGKNKTEKLYFNNFDNGKKNYSISFAKGNYTDPLNLVKMLIEEMKKKGIIISGFGGVGKTYLAKKYKNVVDLESSPFKYDYSNIENLDYEKLKGEPNRIIRKDYPENYIKAINA